MGYRNTSWSLLCSEQRLCNRPGIESRFLHSLCDANISDSCCTYISTWCLLKADTVCWSCKSYLCLKPSLVIQRHFRPHPCPAYRFNIAWRLDSSMGCISPPHSPFSYTCTCNCGKHNKNTQGFYA